VADKQATQKDKKKAAREARLAKALRENLRRRKKANAPMQSPSPSQNDATDGEDQGENKA